MSGAWWPRPVEYRRIAPRNVVLGLALVLGGMSLVVLLTTAAHATTLTFSKVQTCKVATVSKKGDDVILRCDGKEFTITNQPLSCPAFRYTIDARGNPVVVC